MKVKDLIKLLQEADPEAKVICWLDDDGEDGRPFEIDDVSDDFAVLSRDENDKPRVRFERGGEAIPIAVLEITGDF